MRVAVYYAPAVQDTLWQLGCQWLGRDPESNARLDQPDVPGIAEITAEARLYGFHATLQPPMTLRPGIGWDRVVTDADELAASIAPFELPPLKLANLRGFLAVVDAEHSPTLQSLADACVRDLDHLRAPPSDEDLARRRRAKLTPEQDAMLVRWGYPYVFETWFFHMTLTRRLSAVELAVVLPVAEAYFAETLKAPRMVREICLFTQTAPGAAFVLAERLALRGAAH